MATETSPQQDDSERYTALFSVPLAALRKPSTLPASYYVVQVGSAMRGEFTNVMVLVFSAGGECVGRAGGRAHLLRAIARGDMADEPAVWTFLRRLYAMVQTEEHLKAVIRNIADADDPPPVSIGFPHLIDARDPRWSHCFDQRIALPAEQVTDLLDAQYLSLKDGTHAPQEAGDPGEQPPAASAAETADA